MFSPRHTSTPRSSGPRSWTYAERRALLGSTPNSITWIHPSNPVLDELLSTSGPSPYEPTDFLRWVIIVVAVGACLWGLLHTPGCGPY